MITGRDLLREEIDLIWRIDRREVIEHVYFSELGGLDAKTGILQHDRLTTGGSRNLHTALA